MDVWTLMRTALRRWYIFLPVVGASLAVGYSMASNLDPVYTTESSAILTAPEIIPGTGLQAGELIEVNPYLNLGGGLTTTTQVMVVLMDSQPQRLDYLDRGLEPEYEVSRTDAVIFFTVTGTDSEAVTTTANELVAIADDEVAILQDRTDVPPEQRIQVRPLSLPESAIEDGGASTQLMAILGVLGLVAALAAAVALDGFLRWWHTHRAARAERTVGSAADEASNTSANDAAVDSTVVNGSGGPAATPRVAAGTRSRPPLHERRDENDDEPTAGRDPAPDDKVEAPNLPRRTSGATQPDVVSAPTGSTST